MDQLASAIILCLGDGTLLTLLVDSRRGNWFEVCLVESAPVRLISGESVVTAMVFPVCAMVWWLELWRVMGYLASATYLNRDVSVILLVRLL